MTRKYLIYALVAAGLVAASVPALAQMKSISSMPVDDIVKALKSEGRVSMSGTVFESDSAKLTVASSGVLAKLADSMTQLPAARLAVVGHTDITGAYSYSDWVCDRCKSSHG